MMHKMPNDVAAPGGLPANKHPSAMQMWCLMKEIFHWIIMVNFLQTACFHVLCSDLIIPPDIVLPVPFIPLLSPPFILLL
uniref:Uncharacterized protein n=1 Tax=Arundo donax TaxID=35708 RepID=A0A0A8ZTY2_ARUDO